MEVTELPPKTYRRPTPADRIKARAMYTRGEGSATVIAKLLNLTPSTVKEWVIVGDWVRMREDFEATQLAKLERETRDDPANSLPPISPQSLTSAQTQAERIAGQMKDIEEMMKGMTNADSLAKLATAHSKLFASWQTLTGTPNPGSRKTARPGRVQPPALQPVEAPPEVPQAPASVDPGQTGTPQPVDVSPVSPPVTNVNAA